MHGRQGVTSPVGRSIQSLGPMRKLSRSFAVVLLLSLSGCATVDGADEAVPTTKQLVGNYCYGHAGFAESLDLHSDGTYERIVAGHLGFDDQTDSGSWRSVANRIEFVPGPGKHVHPGPETSEIFFHRNRPAFAPLRYIKDEKAYDWFVYLPCD
jgi:hypothetical protein